MIPFFLPTSGRTGQVRWPVKRARPMRSHHSRVFSLDRKDFSIYRVQRRRFVIIPE